MTVIGLDYTPAYEQGGGIGRYVRELVAALAEIDTDIVFRLFVAGARRKSDLPSAPASNFEWRPSALSTRWLARLWHRATIPYPVEQWTGSLNLFHATDFVLPPLRRGTRSLLTVHDLSFVMTPETASPRLRRYLETVVPRSVGRADHILADSEATKTDLVRLYHVEPDRITVLLSGVSAHFQPVTDLVHQAAVRAKYGLGAWPFLFTVGTVQPRKNYARLCEALALLGKQYAELHLVIAGGKGWLEDPIYAAVEQFNVKDRVHFVGFAEEQDLPTLYSMAEAVPFVSLYEGFGLPVLEGMACGTPVVASNISSIPEVAGHAAVLVDPYSSEDIAAGLARVLEDSQLKLELRAKGFIQAQRFTWEHSARRLLQIYRGLLS